MKRLGIFIGLFGVAIASPMAASETIYDLHTHHSLQGFSLFGENTQELLERPVLGLTESGLEAMPGKGNFTAWEFSKIDSPDFEVSIIFSVPEALNSNSGVFILFGDPWQTSFPNQRHKKIHQTATEAVKQKKSSLGAGPFELDFFAYEVQLARGKATRNNPPNISTGAFYGVEVGTKPGQQEIFSSYDLQQGETYELLIVANHKQIESFLRPAMQNVSPVLISRLRIPSAQRNPVRGGTAKSILLQSYWNNGTSAKSFVFKRIEYRQD